MTASQDVRQELHSAIVDLSIDGSDDSAAGSVESVLLAKLERLAQFEEVAEQLWPFVRYFILAGAHPDAIAAVVRLGQLLGHTEASQSTLFEIGDKVRRETLSQVADVLSDSLKGKILAREIGPLCDKVRAL